MLATVDHAADAGDVAHLELADAGSNGADAADDLVARHRRIEGVLPLFSRSVQVRVSDAAIQDVNLDVIRARVAALDCERGERHSGSLGSVGKCCGHWIIP